MSTDLTTLVTDAQQAARAVADAADIELRLLTQVDEFRAVVQLLQHIWKSDATTPANVETLRAISKAGSYVGGAFDGDRLVGASFGFYGSPADHSLHSHIAGVASGMRGRNVGFALKLHQRAWALEHDVAEISWTFDPLIRRNAYFNIVKLGATPAEYHQNFYGQMSDAINGIDDTDRMLVRWRVGSDAVAAAARGTHARPRDVDASPILSADANHAPVVHVPSGRFVSAEIPQDIEALRANEPITASHWRIALRDTLGIELASGSTVLGFDRHGRYIIDRGEQQ